MTATPNIRLVVDESVDAMIGLESERERLTFELTRLHVFGERRAAAEARLAEVDDALKVVDSADREAVRMWAADTDHDAPAPEPLLDERRRLLARRVDLQAEIDAAVVADAAVEAQRAALRGQLKANGVQILQVRLNTVVAVARDLQRHADDIAVTLSRPLQQIVGLRAALAQILNAAVINGDQGAQQCIVAASAELDALKPPVIERDPAAIEEATAEWLRDLR